MVQESANMLYLQNNVVYSFSLGKLLFANRIFGFYEKAVADIRGTGYVVESLEAALWCFEKSDSFKSAILSAVNLGDDADTTAAVCGQLAGAYYGYKGMPSHWKEQLCMHDKILGICDELFNAS